MKNKLHLLFLFTALISLFMACVKNTDLSQTDDILITPTVALDFLFFNYRNEKIPNGYKIINALSEIKSYL